MNQITALKPGSFWVHTRKGTKYVVMKITNQYSTDPEKFPLMVSYVDEQGREWSRPVADFLQSFTESQP